MPLQDWMHALSPLPMLSLNMGKRSTDGGPKTIYIQIIVSLVSAVIIGLASGTATAFWILGDLKTGVQVNAANINGLKDNLKSHIDRHPRRDHGD